MQFFSVIVATAAGLLASSVYTSAIPPSGPPDHAIDVALTPTGNTRVKVTVTNNADHEMAILNMNSLLDPSPIQKSTVYREGESEELPFSGTIPRYDLSHLDGNDFTLLPSSASVDSEFELSDTFDLSAGGTYTVLSRGVLPVGAPPNCTHIDGVIPYESNRLKLHVDGALAAHDSSTAFYTLSRRSEVKCDDDSQHETVARALRNAGDLASRAADAVRNNDDGISAKLEEYFHASDPDTRETVAGRFAAVAAECAASAGTPDSPTGSPSPLTDLSSSSGNNNPTNKGITAHHCTDPFHKCGRRTIAYTLPVHRAVVNCDSYYKLPSLTRQCHVLDQASTTLHELTHVSALFRPRTLDHVYGYERSVELDKEEAVCNADSYALFANALNLGC